MICRNLMKGCIVVLAVLAVSIPAYSALWDNGDLNDNHWGTALNWVSGFVPDDSENVYIEQAVNTSEPNQSCLVPFGYTTEEVGLIFLQQTPSSPPANLIPEEAAFLAVEGTLNANKIYQCDGANKAGYILVNGGDLNLSGELFIGHNGPGALEIVSGTVDAQKILLTDHSDLNGIGYYKQTGGVVTSREQFFNGMKGTSTTEISGGTLNCVQFYTAVAANASGTVTISGTGELNCGVLLIGASGSGAAVFNIDGGAVNTSDVLMPDTRESGELNVSGGQLNVTSRLWVGRENSPTQVGTLTITGGTINAESLLVPSGSSVYLQGGTINLTNHIFDLLGGTVDFDGGTLVMDGNYGGAVQNAINNGYFVSSLGYVLYDYDVTNPGKTTVIGTDVFPVVPANGISSVSTLPYFAWDTETGTYTLYISTDPDPFTNSDFSYAGLTDPAYQMAANDYLDPDTVYYWGYNDGSSNSTVSSFTTEGPVCDGENPLSADINEDCLVTLADFAEVANQWLGCNLINGICP